MDFEHVTELLKTLQREREALAEKLKKRHADSDEEFKTLDTAIQVLIDCRNDYLNGVKSDCRSCECLVI